MLQAVHAVQGLDLDRVLGADQETREARNAQIRRVGTGVAAAALLGVSAYAVFPFRLVLDQRAATERSREQVEMLSQANDRLEEQAERLRTDEEIERLARRDYGLVKPREEPYRILPAPEDTTTTTAQARTGESAADAGG